MSLIRKNFNGNTTGIAEACSFVRETLSGYKIPKKAILRAALSLEESAAKLIEAANGEVEINVAVRKSFFDYSIELSAPGEEIAFYDSSLVDKDKKYETNQYTEAALRNILIGAMGDSLRYIHKSGLNKVLIKVLKIERSMLFFSVMALILAVIVGIILRNFASAEIQNMICTYGLTPLTTMFMNALKMLVVPVVFFSIITSVSQFSNISEFGKLGSKVVGFYIASTIIAAIIGILTFKLVDPGELGSCKETFAKKIETVEAKNKISIEDFSIVKTIVNIVPDNIIKPYSSADMLQIIFLAVLLGTSISMIGEYSLSIKNLLDGCNLLFLNATTLVIKVIPLAIFTSIADLVLKTKIDTMWQIGGFLFAFLLALVFMAFFYCLMIRFVGNLNPAIFFKKYAPVTLKAFTLSSSNACIPDSIQGCSLLGISDKIYAFSIPMGATINMNGTCLCLVLAVLFLGKLCGIEFGGSDYFTVVFLSLVMSVGCPGIPGASIVCLSVMMMQLGIPSGAIILLMGFDSILSMFRTAFNVTGDAVCSLIIAKREKLLDEEKFNSVSE